MKLNELRSNAQAAAAATEALRLVAISQRKTILLVKLDKLGISREDGWILRELPPDTDGVTIGHPDLPRSARAFLSTDGTDTILISVFTLGGVGVVPTSAWDIAQELGATL
jgi:hypothetical protein